MSIRSELEAEVAARERDLANLQQQADRLAITIENARNTLADLDETDRALVVECINELDYALKDYRGKGR